MEQVILASINNKQLFKCSSISTLCIDLTCLILLYGQPAIIVIFAGSVGVLLASVLLPIYSITTAI